jgi:hypothetical protein
MIVNRREYTTEPYEELLEEWKTGYEMDLVEQATLREDRYDLIDELDQIEAPYHGAQQ